MTSFIYSSGDPNQSTTYGTGYTSETYNFNRLTATNVTNAEDIKLLKLDENLTEVPVPEVVSE